MSSPTVPVRIVMDVTTCGRWVGPDVGIVRVERRLADWARRACDGVVFVVCGRSLRLGPFKAAVGANKIAAIEIDVFKGALGAGGGIRHSGCTTMLLNY